MKHCLPSPQHWPADVLLDTSLPIDRHGVRQREVEGRKRESFSFSFSSRWHRSARKGPYALRPVSQQSPQGYPQNRANIWLVEHRSFSTLEGGMSVASFLHSSFLQEVRAVMLWIVRAEKVPQASEHLCPAKLQTSVISVVLASLSARSFPLTPACPGQ